MGKIILIIFGAMILVSCANAPKQKENYKILWGKRCTESGNQYSYVWFHTVQGEETVKKEWCKNVKK